MDIKQLVTGDPKTGFYPITQDTITVIELNKAVISLTNESGSEEIIVAFDNLESFQALIAEVRNPQNICSGILINETPEDKRVGKYEASIIANTDTETLHVRWIEIDKIVALTITNTDGTMSCIRNENNVGGDKTNVLILSLENDLANGQKDSPVETEVSTALKDAITNGKACVIKSSNSDILANLQQISDNVTIVMEQISRIGQTFVAVNTTITVNTATNVISDYQTGGLVLKTEGDGSKFLSNDGTYKGIPQPDLSNYLAKNNTTEFTPDTDYEPATKKYVDDNISLNNKNVFVVNDGYNLLDIDNYSEWTETISIPKKLSSDNTLFIINMNSINTNDNFNSNIIVSMRTKPVNSTIVCRNNISDAVGNKYNINILIKYKNNPSDDNYYSATFTCEQFKYVQRVLTETEYAALGKAVNTDNVLYFVTPDA
jgi:hypothetical protein